MWIAQVGVDWSIGTLCQVCIGKVKGNSCNKETIVKGKYHHVMNILEDFE